MAEVGDTSYLAGGLIDVIQADAIAQLAKASVTKNLVTIKSAPRAETISWSVFNDATNVLDSGDVAATDEGTVTPTSALDSESRTATMDMYSIGTRLYDSAKLSNADNPEEMIGVVMGNAMAAKHDELLNALFDGFSTSVGSTTAGTSVDNLFSALSAIEEYQHLSQIYAVLHRKQIWGAYGLMNDLVTSSQFGGSPSVQDEGLRNGMVSKVAGLELYNSNELSETSTAVKATKGGVFTREALGFGYVGDIITVEQERQATYIRDAFNVHSFCGVVELKDAAGVELYTKTSA